MYGTRVTQRSMTLGAMDNLQASLRRSDQLAQQLTSGRRIQRPSDDATGAISAMQNRAEKRALEQHLRNTDDGLGWLNTADSALQTAGTIVRSAYEKVIQAANDSNSLDSRQALAQEIEAIRDQLLSVANTQYGGRPVFGGTDASTQAVTVTGGTATFAANVGASVNRQVDANTTVAVNTPADKAFSIPGATAGTTKDFYAILTKTADDIRASKNADITPHIDDLQKLQTSISNALTSVGARTQQLDSLKSRGEDVTLQYQSRIANIESIDLAKTIMEVQLQEVAHKAALGATAKVMQPTLMDFLR